jgi:hopene-associated glycosyltransferase HpnB
MALALAALSCGIWIYLLVARGRFWRCSERLERVNEAQPAEWPSVVAVVPARDEIEVIEASVTSLLRQTYAGEFSIIVVDDHSSDGTAEAARRAAAALGAQARLAIVQAPSLPAGWTGKLWALKHGVAHAGANASGPDYLWMTDADISYSEDALSQLVSRACGGNLVLTSVMAQLRCESLAERALIPAFVFFFQMLYPFAWVNDPSRRLAAAAGGCMLVRRAALEASGGIDAIRTELIDDCALARQLKRHGPIWLGFSERVRSLRSYRRMTALRQMVARSAYCQLRYSPALLALTAIALSITFLMPAVLALVVNGPAQIVAIAAWALMALAFQPALRLYKVAPAWGAALPAVALVYLWFTIDSAMQHRRARGGMWKGRAQARRRSTACSRF